MSNIFTNIQNKIDKIKQDKANYNNILEKSTTIKNLTPIPTLNNKNDYYKQTLITNISPDINKEKAKLISNLIPINETYLTVIYSKEVLTNKEYYIIPTNKYVWLLNSTEYVIFNYPTYPVCTIIKNIMMGKIIIFNNIVLEITGGENSINDFINIINNTEYRNNKIKEKMNYLCGITPTYQLINKIGAGISIDKNNTIVFHTNNENYKYQPTDIKNYEILYDNSIVYSKELNSTTRITSSHNECYTMTIRITDKQNKSFTMPILSSNGLTRKYTTQDFTFQECQKFSNEIINKLKEIIP